MQRMCRQLPIALILTSVCHARTAASYPTDPVLSAVVDVTTMTSSTPSAYHSPDSGASLSTQHPDTRLIIDSPDDIRPITTDVEAVRSSVVFFSASLSMFAAIAVVLFFRKCVTCPSPGRARYYNRPTEGAEDADADAGANCATPGDARFAFSTPSKLDEIGLSPSVSSLVAVARADDVCDTPDIRPPTRRQSERIESDTPEALCLQDEASDEDEDYV